MNTNNLATAYIRGLKEAYIQQEGGQEFWEHMEAISHGASEKDIQRLKETYPDIPTSLVELLQQVDGTYFRAYGNEELLMFFFGSDVSEGEYPYYLLSAREMVENKNKAYEYYADYVDRAYQEDGVEVDERIINDSTHMEWLHFSDCMNNGGTSQLFIDFSPSEKGIKGQIVRFLHDPDEIKVIADSFNEYLQMLMDNEYAFIDEDSIEW